MRVLVVVSCVLIMSTYCVGQEIEVSIVNGRVLQLGTKGIELVVSRNIDFIGDQFEFVATPLNFYDLRNDGNGSLKVKLDIPFDQRCLGPDIDGKISVIIKDKASGNEVNSFDLGISSNVPQFSPNFSSDGPLVIGDLNYKRLRLNDGQNFLGIIDIIERDGNVDIKFDKLKDVTSNETIEFGIRPMSVEATSINLTVRYVGLGEDGPSITSAVNLPLNLQIMNPPTSFMSIAAKIGDVESNELYVDDLQMFNDIEFVFTLPPTLPAGFSIANSKIIFDDPSAIPEVTGLTLASSEVSKPIKIDLETVRLGTKKVSLVSSKSGTVYFIGYFKLLAKPLPQVVGASNDEITVDPLGLNEIVIEGVSIKDLEIRGQEDYPGVSLIPSYVTANSIRTKIEFDIDLLDLKGDYYLLVARKNANKIYKRLKVNVREPRLPFAEFDRFIKVKEATNSYEFNVNNKEYEIDRASVKNLLIEISRDDIPKRFGNQLVDLKLSIFDEQGNQLKTISIEESGRPLLVKNKKIYPDEQSKTPMGVPYDEFKNQLFPFGYILIEVSHGADFYPLERSEDRRRRTIKLRIKGKPSDNFRISINVPQGLYTFGVRKKEVESQIMPLNIGFGVVYQLRDKNNELRPIDFGLYLVGLNLVSPEESEPDENFIRARDVGLLFVGQWYPLQVNVTRRIPVQFGIGYTIPSNGGGNKYFGTVGISYNINSASK